MSSMKKNAVDEKPVAVAESTPAAAPKAAQKTSARAKKAAPKVAKAVPGFASRRVWPD